MRIPNWIKKFNGWRTKPEGLIWSYCGWIDIHQGNVYTWTRKWKQNKWGVWYVSESSGK